LLSFNGGADLLCAIAMAKSRMLEPVMLPSETRVFAIRLIPGILIVLSHRLHFVATWGIGLAFLLIFSVEESGILSGVSVEDSGSFMQH
jgi:hypothetical protein